MLEFSFMEEEVRTSLKEMNGEKAPSLMVFSWDSIKNDVLAVFRDFFEMGKFMKSLNSTFLVMIPKKDGVEDFKDFRPVILVGSFYNLIAKVVSNRL